MLAKYQPQFSCWLLDEVQWIIDEGADPTSIIYSLIALAMLKRMLTTRFGRLTYEQICLLDSKSAKELLEVSDRLWDITRIDDVFSEKALILGPFPLK